MKRKPGEWWDKSWSVVSGCTPVGAGCDHCWARAMARRFPAMHGKIRVSERPGDVSEYPAPFDLVLCHAERLDEPRRRRKSTIYASSLVGDLFHDQVPREFVKAVCGLAADCGRHQFVWLTKRYQRAADFMESCTPTDNVMVLASVWDQASTDAACAALSLVPGLSWGLHMEPLLGPVRLPESRGSMPSWVVVGGENGPGARPMALSWVRQIRDQCAAAGVPFWLKALGTHYARNATPTVGDMHLRWLDGRSHDETPWGHS